MKIAIVTSKISAEGGVEIFNRDISNIFEDRGHIVDMYGRENLPFIPSEDEVERVVGEHFNEVNKSKNYDVVLCNGEFGYAVDHPKTINISHGSYYDYAMAVKDLVDDGLTQQRFKKANLQKESAKNKFVVTVSNYSRNQLERDGIKIDKMIPLSVDTNIFYSMNLEPTDVSLAISRQRYFEKGFDYLVKLGSEGVKIKLFSERNLDFPSIQNMGFGDNRILGEEYNKAQVFLNPTRFEGGGLTTLEAMACGCPVITTPTGYGWDIKEHIPEFISESFTFREFYDKYLLVSSERKKHSKQALEYFKEFHNPDDFKNRWISLVENF
tara:strand:+ start:1703 stop:2677 length:975 start_codon:yes stop_codon:yes gene_type:complete